MAARQHAFTFHNGSYIIWPFIFCLGPLWNMESYVQAAMYRINKNTLSPSPSMTLLGVRSRCTMCFSLWIYRRARTCKGRKYRKFKSLLTPSKLKIKSNFRMGSFKWHIIMYVINERTGLKIGQLLVFVEKIIFSHSKHQYFISAWLLISTPLKNKK